MLTPRQREVAELVARGYTAKRIAREFDISVSTAEAHIRDAAARIPSDPDCEYRAREKLLIFVLMMDDAA